MKKSSKLYNELYTQIQLSNTLASMEARGPPCLLYIYIYIYIYIYMSCNSETACFPANYVKLMHLGSLQEEGMHLMEP